MEPEQVFAWPCWDNIKFKNMRIFLRITALFWRYWQRALVASLLGNAASYFIGLIGSHAPWIVHETGVLE